MKRSGNFRRRSRALALQALYESDLTNHSFEETLQWLCEEMVDPQEVVPFALQLVKGVTKNLEAIDYLIQKYAPAWPVHHMAPVDRNILRLALYEITVEDEVPPKAAINEAVELAKAFGSESAGRFVNGVLGTTMCALEQGLNGHSNGDQLHGVETEAS